jgi:hypothetical protein
MSAPTRHKTKSRMRPALAALVAGGVVAACALAPTAQAQLDPFVPDPPFWCPGNGPGLSASGYGGYCEGKTFPDGTRLNVFRIGYWWQPIRCIIPDGSMNPPLAGPGGCGGVLG